MLRRLEIKLVTFARNLHLKQSNVTDEQLPSSDAPRLFTTRSLVPKSLRSNELSLLQAHRTDEAQILRCPASCIGGGRYRLHDPST